MQRGTVAHEAKSRLERAGRHAGIAAEPTMGSPGRLPRIVQLGQLTHLAELQEADPYQT